MAQQYRTSVGYRFFPNINEGPPLLPDGPLHTKVQAALTGKYGADAGPGNFTFERELPVITAPPHGTVQLSYRPPAIRDVFDVTIDMGNTHLRLHDLYIDSPDLNPATGPDRAWGTYLTTVRSDGTTTCEKI